MIEILKNIFLVVMYLFGIGFFGFFAAAIYAALIDKLRKHK